MSGHEVAWSFQGQENRMVFCDPIVTRLSQVFFPFLWMYFTSLLLQQELEQRDRIFTLILVYRHGISIINLEIARHYKSFALLWGQFDIWTFCI